MNKALRSSEHMTLIILIGSFAVVLLLISLLLFNYVSLGNTYTAPMILTGMVSLLYLCLVSYLIYKKHIYTGAWMLVTLYAFMGIFTLHVRGINAPIGVLVLGFVILLTSVMLGAKHIIPVTAGVIGILFLLQYFNLIGVSNPNVLLLGDDSTYRDVFGYSIIFCIFAVVTWLSRVKMENTLGRAITAETTLQKERDALASRVTEQTKSIVQAQHKELKQLYKFAELGQLTTIILHELANHLSILTLDIDDIKDRHQSSIAIKHAKESIFYIDTIIEQVRNQIKDSDNMKRFDALALTRDTIKQLQKRLKDSNIKLFIESSDARSYFIFGDPLRLSQAITILVTNATQANHNKRSEISIEISSTKFQILISVKDLGTGITQEVRKTLFQPQQNKTGTGLGIGLYVTKQIIDTHFKGKIWLSPATEYTQFNIEIPKTRK